MFQANDELDRLLEKLGFQTEEPLNVKDVFLVLHQDGFISDSELSFLFHRMQKAIC